MSDHVLHFRDLYFEQEKKNNQVSRVSRINIAVGNSIVLNVLCVCVFGLIAKNRIETGFKKSLYYVNMSELLLLNFETESREHLKIGVLEVFQK